MNVFTNQEKHTFEAEVMRCFGFMVDQFGMNQGKVRVSGGNDPRDSVLVVRYSRDDLKIDIGWKENEAALIITVRFDRVGLSRQERHVYFEPFAEFQSDGEVKAVVPFLTESMGIKRIESVMAERKELFQQGLHEVIGAIGQKLKTHFGMLESASPDAIRRYHTWMKMKR